MSLKAGTMQEYTGSMAEAIEHAFKQEWPNVMENMELPASSPQMKLMFVAVAQGIVRHLKEHAGSFEVKVSSSGGHTHSATVTIKTEGTLYTKGGSIL